MKELRVRDIENMKAIGGYDDYLKGLNANRNASIDYLLYLENLQVSHTTFLYYYIT